MRWALASDAGITQDMSGAEKENPGRLVASHPSEKLGRVVKQGRDWGENRVWLESLNSGEGVGRGQARPLEF